VKLQEAHSLAESRTEELDGVRARLSESLEDASRLKAELQNANSLAESIGKELGEARVAAGRSDDEHVSRYEEVMGRLAGSEAEVARLESERDALSAERDALSAERDALSECISRAAAESEVRFEQSMVYECMTRSKAGLGLDPKSNP
jgi:predicted RNase H-like nuclease (RuvC/YqgF family)